MNLSKTDFIQFLACPNSLWLKKKKPDVYPVGQFSEYERKLAEEGYLVEGYVRQLISEKDDHDKYKFQVSFKPGDGSFARADMVHRNDDGTIDIFEIKSSTSVKTGRPHDQLKDAAFQTIAARRCGEYVSKIFIIHLNKDYVRDGDIEPNNLLLFADETGRVEALVDETELEISNALNMLSMEGIDETSCTCLTLSSGNHCESFQYFNPDVPDPSIYSLPRISAAKIGKFVSEKRFDLNSVSPDEVTRLQMPVLLAHQTGTPYVDMSDIDNFMSVVEYPLYFLDYETYASAIPISDGTSPHKALPFQFSLHVLHDDGRLEHHEYIAENAELPFGLVQALQEIIGPTGSIVSWNKAFENTQNVTMGQQYPDKREFLDNVISRTIDLMDVFKTGYVDICFGGSTSIKKVLPVIVPELSYDGMAIADGTAAMDGWYKMLNEKNNEARTQLRGELLKYCELDTFAMVRIFQFVDSLHKNTQGAH